MEDRHDGTFILIRWYINMMGHSQVWWYVDVMGHGIWFDRTSIS